MAMPKSVIRFKKGNVEFVSEVDRASYTIDELTRAALRDVGKFIVKEFRKRYYAKFDRRTGRVGRFTQYWVKTKGEIHLEVGMKPNAFYGGFQELGTSTIPKEGLLAKSVEENIDTIIKIESKYLSALESEAEALAKIRSGGAVDEDFAD